MHTLAVDIGNTTTKIALFNKDILLQTFVFARFEPILVESILKQNKVEQVIISNVSNHTEWVTFFKNNTQVLEISALLKLPFKNLYQTPHTLGVDRIALVAGAMHFYKNTNCLIIDCGTCITYDFLNADSEYLGGAISPGLHTRLKAMNTFTGKLPLLTFVEPNYFIGQNTEECMQIGAFKGMVLEIEGFINHYQQNYPLLQVLLTGGDAQVLAKHFKNNIFATDNLLLYGLNKILEYNV